MFVKTQTIFTTFFDNLKPTPADILNKAFYKIGNLELPEYTQILYLLLILLGATRWIAAL